MNNRHTFNYTNLDELDVDTSPLYGMDDLESQIVPTTFTDKDREIIKEYEKSKHEDKK